MNLFILVWKHLLCNSIGYGSSVKISGNTLSASVILCLTVIWVAHRMVLQILKVEALQPFLQLCIRKPLFILTHF